MSLYNLLHGTNRFAPIVLAILGLQEDDFGRFRDAWIDSDGTHLVVLTRCGGNNREYYSEVFDGLSSRPEYISDIDDDFDNTYAIFKFGIPKQYCDLINKLKPEKPELSLRDKFNYAMLKQEISKSGQSDDVVEKIMRIIYEALRVEQEELRRS